MTGLDKINNTLIALQPEPWWWSALLSGVISIAVAISAVWIDRYLAKKENEVFCEITSFFVGAQYHNNHYICDIGIKNKSNVELIVNSIQLNQKGYGNLIFDFFCKGNATIPQFNNIILKYSIGRQVFYINQEGTFSTKEIKTLTAEGIYNEIKIYFEQCNIELTKENICVFFDNLEININTNLGIHKTKLKKKDTQNFKNSVLHNKENKAIGKK